MEIFKKKFIPKVIMEYPNKNMYQYYTDQGTPLGKVLQLLANFEKKTFIGGHLCTQIHNNV